MNNVPMTLSGANQLRVELDQLKHIDRPRIVKAIEEARAHGDLKENAEYHAAKEQQGLTEARIRDIEHKLSHANIINPSQIKDKNVIVFTATVHLINTETEKESVYQIVGDEEADIKLGKLSVTSPLARAIIGKRVGDIAEVAAPSGKIEYAISKIEYII